MPILKFAVLFRHAIWQILHREAWEMDEELKQQLTYLNENLKAAVANQYALYMELKEVVEELSGKKIDSP